MKLQIVEKGNSEIKFVAEGIQPSFANELRRIMTNETPTMAIEYVDFVKNDSALNDEIVANRLGQVPLKFEKKLYNITKSCKCDGKGCSLCQVKLSLKKKGPSVVYSGDLKSKNKDIAPVFDKIPITELFDGQEMEFEAIATLGVGKEHTKWQGSVVGYTNLWESSTKAAELKLCDNHAFHVRGVKAIKSKPLECALCKSFNDEDGKFKPIEDSFIFSVESASGLGTDEIISDSSTILEEKLKEFDRSVKKIKENS